jgi:hypothetical protein
MRGGKGVLVVRKDNHYDYVNDFMLDGLIKSKQIVKFKRNTEWVKVGEAQTSVNKSERVFNGTNRNRLAINDSIFVSEDRKAFK